MNFTPIEGVVTMTIFHLVVGLIAHLFVMIGRHGDSDIMHCLRHSMRVVEAITEEQKTRFVVHTFIPLIISQSLCTVYIYKLFHTT